MTFDRSHKGSLFAAYESSCAETYLYIEGEISAEYVFAQQAAFSCLFDSYFKSFNGYRIFSADINVSLFCTDSISCDSHSLDNCVRIALENRTVHESAGIRSRRSFFTSSDG